MKYFHLLTIIMCNMNQNINFISVISHLVNQLSEQDIIYKIHEMMWWIYNNNTESLLSSRLTIIDNKVILYLYDDIVYESDIVSIVYNEELQYTTITTDKYEIYWVDYIGFVPESYYFKSNILCVKLINN